MQINCLGQRFRVYCFGLLIITTAITTIVSLAHQMAASTHPGSMTDLGIMLWAEAVFRTMKGYCYQIIVQASTVHCSSGIRLSCMHMLPRAFSECARLSIFVRRRASLFGGSCSCGALFSPHTHSWPQLPRCSE